MARIFITGSADGLGQLAAKALIAEGHKVVLHARSETRAEEALAKTPCAETIVTGDLSNMEETKELASKVNALGAFDAIIHNAAVFSDKKTWLIYKYPCLQRAICVRQCMRPLTSCLTRKPVIGSRS